MRHERDLELLGTAKRSAEAFELDFAEAFRTLWRNRSLIALCVGGFVALAVGYLLVTPTQYTAVALLLIDSRSNTLPSQQLRVTDANSESAYVETQVGVLKSERIARAVITDQKLFDIPEFKEPAQDSKREAQPSPPVASEAALSTVPASAVKQFARRMDVKRSQSTFLIEIGFTYTDPRLAAEIANAIARSYLADRYAAREQALRNTSQWLQVRALDLRRETQNAEIALDEFRNNNPGNTSRSVLRDLESTAQTYRAISESFLKRFLEISQEQYFSPVDARIVSEAWPPASGSYPKKLLVIAVAAAMGLAAGFVLALVRGASEADAESSSPKDGVRTNAA